jgi:UDP-N-acetylglucosamine 2-epimerase
MPRHNRLNDPTTQRPIPVDNTDQISDFLFTPSRDGNENLKKEGIPEEKIFLVGNVMVDSLLFNLEIPNYRCLAPRL